MNLIIASPPRRSGIILIRPSRVAVDIHLRTIDVNSLRRAIKLIGNNNYAIRDARDENCSRDNTVGLLARTSDFAKRRRYLASVSPEHSGADSDRCET